MIKTLKNKRRIQPFWSLKYRLMILITLILLVVVGFPVGYFVYQLDNNYHNFSVNMIETTAQIVYQNMFDAMMNNDGRGIQRIFKLLSNEPTIETLRLYLPSGEILYSSHENEIHKNIRDLPEEVSFFKSGDKEVESFKRIGNIFSHHHPIYVQEECTPCHLNKGELKGILDVEAGFIQTDQLYDSSKKLVLFGGAFIILILWFLFNFIFQSQIERKLNTIIGGFKKIASNDFDYRIHLPGRDELAYLGEKFNEMVHNLKQSRQKEENLFLEKLQRADRLVTLGEIAAEIAHEVNNPAGIILTRAEILKDEIRDPNQKSPCSEDLDIIIQQTKRIAETTRSILHYARKLPKKFSKTDIRDSIRHSIKILEPRLKKSNVDVRLNLPDQPVFILGDFYQMEQVFCNLINNSLDVMKTNTPVIEISVRQQTDEKGRQIFQIIYQDRGPGIPPQFRNQIFNPFFTTKGEGKGTGLGLFIAKNIISNHKGSIWLGDYAKGAQFLIEFEAHYG